MNAACPPHSRLLTAQTMVFWVEIWVSVASSLAISRIAVLAILQTIALPTELPRREAHFTRNSECPTRPKWSNGLEDYLRSGAQWSPRVSTTTSRPLLTIGVSKHRHHCPSQTIAQSRTPGFQAQGMYVSRTRNTAAGTTRAASRRR